jgi:hypothetical protein
MVASTEMKRTHMIETDGLPLPVEVKEADILTQWAIQARYPDAIINPQSLFAEMDGGHK